MNTLEELTKSFAQVIGLIADNAVDHRAVSLELAKSAPDVFLMLVEKVKSSSLTSVLDKDLKVLIAEGSMIEAIKMCRAHTGKGLKEAKDYVDALRSEMRGGTISAEMEKIMRAAKPPYPDEASF